VIVWHPPLESGGGAIEHYELRFSEGHTRNVSNTFYVTTGEEQQESSTSVQVREIQFINRLFKVSSFASTFTFILNRYSCSIAILEW